MLKVPLSNAEYAELADMAEAGRGKYVKLSKDMLSKLTNSYSILFGELQQDGTRIQEGTDHEAVS